MKKKKFTKAERESIVADSKDVKNKKLVAEKYGVHVSTLYGWISDVEKPKNRNHTIGVKVSKEEKERIFKRAAALGYEENISAFMRKVVMQKHILIGNPKEVREELYRTRGEINKIGSNLNQIANYTNFLKTKEHVDKDFIQNIIKEASRLNDVCLEMKDAIDKAIRKIFR